MAIEFEIRDNELILCYSPYMGTEGISKSLSEKGGISIKHTFWVTKGLLRSYDDEDEDFEETLRFRIGEVGKSYTAIDPEVIGSDHNFFFGNEIKLKPEMFVAYRNISILRKIDNVIEKDFYIGGDWKNNEGISFETFKELLEKFPKTSELDKYANFRIADILKNIFLNVISIKIYINNSSVKRRVLLNPKLKKHLFQISKLNWLNFLQH